MNALSAPGVRSAPVNFEAEQALLGAMLLQNRAYDDVAAFLKPDHFAHPVHGEVYAAIGAMIETGKKVTTTTLKGMFQAEGSLDRIGGPAYLAGLVTNATSIRNAADYGLVILDMAKRRAAMDIGQELILAASHIQPNQTAQEILLAHDQEVVEIIGAGAVGAGLVSLGGGLDEALLRTAAAFKGGTGLTGVTTGLTELDQKTGGLQPGNLIILGARPSMGKTTLAASIMLGAARAGHGVGFFSMEMTKEEIAWLLLANMTGIPAEDQRKGKISTASYGQLDMASRELRKLPFMIDDTAAQPVAALRAKARQLKRQGNLKLIVVDYLQLVRAEGRRGNRTEDVTEISAGLKALAKELQIPVLALSQLSRNVEQRENKRPMLADLRESGGIEQDADVVAFLYRDEYYLSREAPAAHAKPEIKGAYDEALDNSRGKAELIMPKVRMGSTGTVMLGCNLAASRFTDLHHAAHQEDMGL